MKRIGAGISPDEPFFGNQVMQTLQGTQAEGTKGVTLQPARRSAWLEHVGRRLATTVVGQRHAVEAILRVIQRIEVGAAHPRRPLGSVLLLGPPGCGKTHSVETLAEALLGEPTALLKVNCAEYQQQHEISRLVGAPPGYIGHADTEPVFTPENLERPRTPGLPYTLVLFDEIEKAHPSLYSLLLGILDRAELNNGRNRQVDFQACLFFFTSNLGSRECQRASECSGFIPAPTGDEVKLRDFRNAALRAVKRHFPPEFLRRIEETVVFHPLRTADLKNILELELARVKRGFRNHPRCSFEVHFTDSAKALLLQHGCDTEYGAAHLHRTLAREVTDPLYRLIATEQVRADDSVWVLPEGAELRFRKF